mgnify:CR=1 FL=1
MQSLMNTLMILPDMSKREEFWIVIDVPNHKIGVFPTKSDVAKSLGIHRHTVKDGKLSGASGYLFMKVPMGVLSNY